MADWSELKRLAERENQLFEDVTPEASFEWPGAHDELAAVLVGGCFTKTILALITENEAMQERLQIVDIVHGPKAEQRWAALSAECNRRLAALERVRDRLKAAGATLSAPAPEGSIESAMVQGLCIALALVEEELSVPKQDTGNARLRRKLQERVKSETQGEEQLRADLSAERSRAAVLEQNCAEMAEALERVRADAERYRGVRRVANSQGYTDEQFDAQTDARIAHFEVAMGKGGRADG